MRLRLRAQLCCFALVLRRDLLIAVHRLVRLLGERRCTAKQQRTCHQSNDDSTVHDSLLLSPCAASICFVDGAIFRGSRRAGSGIPEQPTAACPRITSHADCRASADSRPCPLRAELCTRPARWGEHQQANDLGGVDGTHPGECTRIAATLSYRVLRALHDYAGVVRVLDWPRRYARLLNGRCCRCDLHSWRSSGKGLSRTPRGGVSVRGARNGGKQGDQECSTECLAEDNVTGRHGSPPG